MEPQMRTEDFVTNLLILLDETAKAPRRPGGSAYLDRDSGFLQTLGALDVEQALRHVAGGPSIAAHIAHALYYVDVNQAFMDGREPVTDWPGSWRLDELTPEAWEDLKRRFLTSLEVLGERVRHTEQWSDDLAGGAMAILVHTAYHLGAVRQMLRHV
jgi:hypothetical protein